MAESAAVPPILNKTMRFFLRSPLHGVVSRYLLLISFTGRKSGRTYTTPVSYRQKEDQVIIFTHANWWKNLRGGAPVSLRLKGKEVQGQGEPITDKALIADELAAHLKQSPFDAKYYDVSFDDQGDPFRADVEKPWRRSL